ncbi:MAG TPA: LysR family transcriptional regulator, partial [Chitinophagaceae bacterium]|nr:LysR family transcriptional regulator [Chitinophagaceae bacterium]
MNYTFHQLKVFVAIASHHSITRAAEELHLTQPAVSLQLKTLQDQFEIPLTEIIGRRLYVTDFGRSVAQAAERILQEASMLEYQAKAYKGLLTGKLRISVASTGKYVMPVYLSGFMAANPGIDLEMDVTNKTKVLQSIKDNEVDFSLISVLPDDMLLEQEELLKNPLFLTGAPGRDFFPDKVLDKSVFTDLPL